MINIEELALYVVKPTLVHLGLNEPGALPLVVGTALVESGLCHLVQVGGPAIGLWQMEPATFQDCFDNYLKYKPDLLDAVRNISNAVSEGAQDMAGNLFLGAAMCRIKYLRSPAALPAPGDAAGMAHIHKTVYNTALGAADESVNIPRFQTVIDALS